MYYCDSCDSCDSEAEDLSDREILHDSVVMSSSEIDSEEEVLKLHHLGSDINSPGSSKQNDNASEKSKVKRSRPHKESDCGAGGDQLSDEHSMLGEYITREYELLRLVLSYLNREDLLAATKVCKTWESVANIVLRGRTKLVSMFWMTSKDHSHWKKYLTRLFEKKLFSDPKNCLLFFPPILHSSRKESELASFVNEKMGPSCSMLTLKVEGVIGTDAEDKVFEVENFIAFSGLLLPAMPGVTVRQFHLCKKKVVRLAKEKPELSTEELQHLTGLPLDEEIKCLLLFCTRGAFKERIVYNLVGSLQNRQSTQMVVGGGQVKMILDPKEKSATTCSSQVHIPHIVGLALSGDNLVAASTVLAKDINDEKMTDWAIKEFSGPHLKADQSVGLMFACAGRGENWYNRAHVESHLFKKYFPSSLITGFFCDGEIGLNCLPDTKTNAQISPEKKTKVRLTHWYTTILVYLGFKKPKKRDQTT